MHFSIIALEPESTPKETFRKYLPEDSTLEQNTDYYGQMFTEEERKKAISSEWLKNMFDGIATIDTKEETITFLDSDTIRKTLHEYMKSITKELRKAAKENTLDVYQLKHSAIEYKGEPTLFYVDGCGWTSMEFIFDAVYYPNQTLKIGNIFDAHL